MMSGKRVRIAGRNELAERQMKSCAADDRKILLICIAGKYYATSCTCPHYSAPLEKGILSGKRIICPWHHACFDATTGELLEPPALNQLESFQVECEGDDIFVILPENYAENKIPPLAKCNLQKDERHFVVIGAGAAGYMAAQTLREYGFQGQISLITPEDFLPYDRPNLSKDYLQGSAEEGWMPLRPKEFYKDYDIEVILNRGVRTIAADQHKIEFENGTRLVFDSLLIASGGLPRKPDFPGANLGNVFSLHRFEDADRIIAACRKARKVAIIGAGFIGLETAFSLIRLQKEVTVISPEAVPFEKKFGVEIGELFRQRHAAAGVIFRLGRQAIACQGAETVKEVLLDDGSRVSADVVIIGIGIKPNSAFISGIPQQPDGGIKVDEYFRVAGDIFAAGDIASFPYWYNGEYVRIEHWRTAQQTGRIAAQNMLGKKVPFRGIPFFWTSQVGLQFRYLGQADKWDEIIIDGNISRANFIAYYVRGNKVQAVAGIKYDRELAAAEELMRLNKMPAPEALRNKTADLLKLV